jgi:hypothetical protein
LARIRLVEDVAGDRPRVARELAATCGIPALAGREGTTSAWHSLLLAALAAMVMLGTAYRKAERTSP